jgi:aspartate racemase
MKTVGILGGMGPEATAELYLRIIRRFQQRGAVNDDDFPEVIIISLPIPDVVQNPGELSTVERMLCDAVVRLESAGASFIVIPCNTVMRFIRSIRAAVSIPVVSIVEETTLAVNSKGLRCVGLLGTRMTIEQKLYDGLLMPVITPDADQQKALTKVIVDVLSGRKRADQLRYVVDEMKNQGAQKVILGCTELPLVMSGDDVIDTLDVLAESVVRKSME